MLPPAMSDQDLLGAMITHYEPRIQNCLTSANLKSTQEALAFSLNYNPWKIRSNNTGQRGEISIAKTKIADLMPVFSYAMSGVTAGTGTIGAI
jgi:hypothetical protein